MSKHQAIVAKTAALDYQVFKKAMFNACKIINRHNAVPVLGAVLIKAVTNGVMVTGSDLEIYTSTFVPGSVSKDFAAVIDAHKLNTVMGKVKDAATINLSVDGGHITASIGPLNLNLANDFSEADFEAVDESLFRQRLREPAHTFVMPSVLLEKILRKVSISVSTEETRYYLNGIYMHSPADSGRLLFVATDGHRLCRYDIAAPAGSSSAPGVIIPRKTVMELHRMLRRKGCPEDVMVTVTETGVSFLVGEDELLESKVIDGTFPDYNRVIPISNQHRMVVSPALMLDAIKQVGSIKSERGKAVKLDLYQDGVIVSATDVDFGTASVDIQARNYVELEIGFNSTYLEGILSLIEGEARFHLEDSGSPTVITDISDDEFTAVLMPTRV